MREITPVPVFTKRSKANFKFPLLEWLRAISNTRTALSPNYISNDTSARLFRKQMGNIKMTSGQEMNRISQFRDMASSPLLVHQDTFSQRRQLPVLCLPFPQRTQTNVEFRFYLSSQRGDSHHLSSRKVIFHGKEGKHLQYYDELHFTEMCVFHRHKDP